MTVADTLRRKWRRFMGYDFDAHMADANRAAEEADREFKAALLQLQYQRGQFDTRPPPAYPSDPSELSLDDLRENLAEEDRLVREALDDDQD